MAGIVQQVCKDLNMTAQQRRRLEMLMQSQAEVEAVGEDKAQVQSDAAQAQAQLWTKAVRGTGSKIDPDSCASVSRERRATEEELQRDIASRVENLEERLSRLREVASDDLGDCRGQRYQRGLAQKRKSRREGNIISSVGKEESTGTALGMRSHREDAEGESREERFVAEKMDDNLAYQLAQVSSSSEPDTLDLSESL